MTRIVTALLLVLAALLQGCAAVVIGAAAGGAMVAVDRRQADIMATDERIEIQVTNRIATASRTRDTSTSRASTGRCCSPARRRPRRSSRMPSALPRPPGR